MMLFLLSDPSEGGPRERSDWLDHRQQRSGRNTEISNIIIVI